MISISCDTEHLHSLTAVKLFKSEPFTLMYGIHFPALLSFVITDFCLQLGNKQDLYWGTSALIKCLTTCIMEELLTETGMEVFKTSFFLHTSYSVFIFVAYSCFLKTFLSNCHIICNLCTYTGFWFVYTVMRQQSVCPGLFVPLEVP